MKPAAPTADYWTATRHPWSCTLFVLPLLALYEIGLFWLGPGRDGLRNGADVWLRSALRSIGLPAAYLAPGLAVAILFVWCIWRRHDRPRDLVGAWAGTAAESGLFALALFGCSQVAAHVFASLERARLLDWNSAATAPEPALAQVLRYCGAGIYEEMLFRLILASALLAVLALGDVPPKPAALLAAVLSALTFAAAHHLGAHGDPWDGQVFAFRSLAGIYFAWLFQVRGFGIAVGAHAGYDVLAGLLTPLAA